MFDWVDTMVAGDTRQVLRGLPDGCISACVTSPPYFNKRLFSVQPLLWGGDPECDHDFSLATIGGDFRVNKVGATTTVGANKAMADWAEKKHGNEYRNHLGPLASPYAEGVAQGHYIHQGSTQSDIVSGGQITDGFVEEAYCIKCGCWRGSLGNEPNISQFISNLMEIFCEVYRVLRADGSCWVNLGDTFWGGGHGGNTLYSAADGDVKSLKQGNSSVYVPTVKWGNEYPNKCLCMIPERFAIAMQEHGWIVRQVIAWTKTNSMPEAVTDRFSSSWEYIYHFVKQGKYFFDQQFEPQGSDTHSKGLKLENPVKDRGSYKDWAKYTPVTYLANGRNQRNIFNVNTSPCDWEFCNDCKRLYVRAERREIKIEKWTNDKGIERRKRICVCGSSTGWIDHFASYSTRLIEPLIKASVPKEICCKCGKPREAIYEKTGEVIQQRWSKTSKLAELQGLSEKSGIYRQGVLEKKLSGYSDCGCKDYYCNNCKTFLTKNVINSIITMKGDGDYAIQGHREAQSISEELGKKSLSKNEGIGCGDVRPQRLQGKGLLNLWDEILCKKDATDLFEELRSKMAGIERKSQQLEFERGQKSTLEGGEETAQFGLCLHLDSGSSICNQTGICDGAQVGNGKVSREIFEQKRECSPQEWDKGRQQDREPRSPDTQQPQGASCMSLLSANFYGEIACPFCLSSNIDILPSPLEPGIGLDPFMGSGTTAIELIRQGKHYFGIDLNADYVGVANARCEREKEDQALLLPKKQKMIKTEVIRDSQLEFF